MADQGRRGFLGDLLREGMRTLAQCRQELAGSGRDGGGAEFFDSYDSSYALTLCEEELMLDSARAAGIPTEGRDSLDIARELFELQKEA